MWINAAGPTSPSTSGASTVEGPAAITVPPGVVHGFRFAPETDGHVLTLSARFLVEGEADRPARLPRALPRAGRRRARRRRPGGGPDRRADSRTLAAEFAAPGGEARRRPRWLARAALWRLAERATGGRSGGNERGRRHQALYLALPAAGRGACPRALAARTLRRALGLSTQRLNRLAHAEGGRSALEIVHERLTREACRRLYLDRRAGRDDRARTRLRRPRLFQPLLQAPHGADAARLAGAAARGAVRARASAHPAAGSPARRSSAVMQGERWMSQPRSKNASAIFGHCSDASCRRRRSRCACRFRAKSRWPPA